jgi:hypothetical protein
MIKNILKRLKKQNLKLDQVKIFYKFTLKIIYLLKIDLKLNDWQAENFFETFDLNKENFTDNIERIDYNEVNLEEFIQNYEIPYKPVMITNAQQDWKAKDKWTFEV